MLKSILQPVLKPVLTNVFGKLTPRNPVAMGLNTDLYAWIDLKDASQMTLSGNNIASVTEKSTNARVFAQMVDMMRPTLTASGALFDDSNDFLTHPNSFLYNIAGGIHVFCFAKVTNTGGGGGDVLFGEYNSLSTTMQYNIVRRSSITGGTPSFRNKLATSIRNSASFYLSESVTQSNDDAFSTEFCCVEIMDLKGVGYYNWINGIAQKVNIADSIARAGLTWAGNVCTIGALQNLTLSGYFGGTISHIVVVNPNITTLQKQEILAWGLNDCGKNNLIPNDNPFK